MINGGDQQKSFADCPSINWRWSKINSFWNRIFLWERRRHFAVPIRSQPVHDLLTFTEVWSEVTGHGSPSSMVVWWKCRLNNNSSCQQCCWRNPSVLSITCAWCVFDTWLNIEEDQSSNVAFAGDASPAMRRCYGRRDTHAQQVVSILHLPDEQKKRTRTRTKKDFFLRLRECLAARQQPVS